MRCSEEPSRAPGRVAARALDASRFSNRSFASRATTLVSSIVRFISARRRFIVSLRVTARDSSWERCRETRARRMRSRMDLTIATSAKNASIGSGSGVDASALEDVRSPISTSRSGAVGASCDFRGFGVREGGERGERWRVAGGEAERTRRGRRRRQGGSQPTRPKPREGQERPPCALARPRRPAPRGARCAAAAAPATVRAVARGRASSRATSRGARPS